MEYKKRLGLTQTEIDASRKKYGSNKMTRRKEEPLAISFIKNLGDPIIRVLLISLAVNIAFTFNNIDWFETGGIVIAILLATGISTISERSSRAAFKRLSEASQSMARVRRNGEITNISTDDIVVGDIVLLCAGDAVCADGILVDGEVSLDQSALTGESKEKEKYPNKADVYDNLSPSSESACLRGCLVSSGEGEMLVTKVGDSTFLGGIVQELQSKTRESPLSLRLSRLAKQISTLGYCAAVLIALSNLFSSIFIESDFVREVILCKLTDVQFMVNEIIHSITLGLTVVIMAVPEGLPMMIAVVLSSNVKRMLKDKVLVRKQTGIEAAGSMNIIFTDKTGTLTRGKMVVESFILPDGKRECGTNSFKSATPDLFMDFCENSLYNSSAVATAAGASGGNATERALIIAAKKHFTPKFTTQYIQKTPFDSKIKYSSATVNGTTYLKGAPEIIIPSIADDDFDRFAVEHAISSAQSEGKRVIMMSKNRRFTCAVVISDPPKKEALTSVEALRRAGIDTVMITGDGLLSAQSIAEQTGIITPYRNKCITHTDLENMTDDELATVLPRLAVLARALPQDKSRLVKIAQRLELVVGMTGDGINDAPALKLSDVGFAMGDGSAVAKDAGDIVILDNNLSSIVKAVLYGRNIFKSIRKFLVFQLTMNFSSAILCMIAPFFGFEAPITVSQMLWVNMIMDTLGGLAFAGEAPQRRIMKEKPKRRDEPILNKYMIHQIFVSGSFSLLISLLFLMSPSFTSHFRASENDLVLLSAFFGLFIFLSVMQCINSRTDRLNIFNGIMQNRAFILIMLLISVLQVSFIYFGGAALRATPLTANELIFTLGVSALAIPFELLRKIVWRFSGHSEGF